MQAFQSGSDLLVLQDGHVRNTCYRAEINLRNLELYHRKLLPVVKQSTGAPRQAEVAQGVPGMLKPRMFLTFRHYKGGRSSAKRTGRLYRRRNPWYSLSEAESTSGHTVLSGVPRKKSPVTPPGIDPGTVRLEAQCLSTDLKYGGCKARVRRPWPEKLATIVGYRVCTLLH